jgi:hypothetical protein
MLMEYLFVLMEGVFLLRMARNDKTVIDDVWGRVMSSSTSLGWNLDGVHRFGASKLNLQDSSLAFFIEVQLTSSKTWGLPGKFPVESMHGSYSIFDGPIAVGRGQGGFEEGWYDRDQRPNEMIYV